MLAALPLRLCHPPGPALLCREASPSATRMILFSTVGAHSTPAWWDTSCGHTPPTLVSCTESQTCTLVEFWHCCCVSSTQPPFSAPHFPGDACKGPSSLVRLCCEQEAEEVEEPHLSLRWNRRWAPRKESTDKRSELLVLAPLTR